MAGGRMRIDYKLKRQCAELAQSGMTYREIYNKYFYPEHKTMSFETFRHKIRKWKEKHYVDDETLEAANLDWGFKPYAATVQISGDGKITQSWIKQSADDNTYAELVKEIRENTQPVKIEREIRKSDKMLEIPLYDLHLGIADIKYYEKTVQETLEIIYLKHWDKIIIPIGQDLFHNDDFRGRTSSGRQIEKVDMVKAWRDAKAIYYAIIEASYEQANEVEIIYIRGNHDESMAWAFTQLLDERYGNTDDGLEYKKVRTYGKCFIGFTHGDGKKSSPKDLRGQFTIKFPIEFAHSTVREIHAGHLHHEIDTDEYGVMCRRLSSGSLQDDWSDSEGYEGAIKRFMIFEWSKEKLASIHYV
jgi:hypothetical protein